MDLWDLESNIKIYSDGSFLTLETLWTLKIHEDDILNFDKYSVSKEISWRFAIQCVSYLEGPTQLIF